VPLLDRGWAVIGGATGRGLLRGTCWKVFGGHPRRTGVLGVTATCGTGAPGRVDNPAAAALVNTHRIKSLHTTSMRPLSPPAALGGAFDARRWLEGS